MRRLLFLISAFGIFLTRFAFANLQVYPTRINLNDKVKVATISLRHLGVKPGHYHIKAVFYRMKPDGTMELAENPKEDERPALNLIRFSPRDVTLTPRMEQVVRVIFAGPRNLPEGEYRAHLHFEPSDDDEKEVIEKSTHGKINMVLQAKLAVSVPVIYRQGNPQFSASLTKLQLVKTPDQRQAFSVDLLSTGSAFAFGDFQAFFIPHPTNRQSQIGESTSSTQINIGTVRSVASYLPQRTVSYPLTIPAGLKLADGVFRLEFREQEDRGGKLIQATEAAIP